MKFLKYTRMSVFLTLILVSTAVYTHAVVDTKTTFGKLSLMFEPNQGQPDKAVQFLAHEPGYSLFLTAKGAAFSLKRPKGIGASYIKPGGCHKTQAQGREALPSTVITSGLMIRRNGIRTSLSTVKFITIPFIPALTCFSTQSGPA